MLDESAPDGVCDCCRSSAVNDNRGDDSGCGCVPSVVSLVRYSSVIFSKPAVVDGGESIGIAGRDFSRPNVGVGCWRLAALKLVSRGGAVLGETVGAGLASGGFKLIEGTIISSSFLFAKSALALKALAGSLSTVTSDELLSSSRCSCCMGLLIVGEVACDGGSSLIAFFILSPVSPSSEISFNLRFRSDELEEVTEPLDGRSIVANASADSVSSDASLKVKTVSWVKLSSID